MTEHNEESDLAATLVQFDRVSANVAKLEKVWEALQNATPDGIEFGLDTQEVEDLIRDFIRIAAELPAIDGFRVEAGPWSRDAIAQARLDASELGEVEIALGVERGIEEPGRQLAEYRYRFNLSRRQLVREYILDVTSQIDVLLQHVRVSGHEGTWKGNDRWEELSDLVSELDRLAGDLVPGAGRWSDLRRHLSFAEPHDLKDIVILDWPSVKAEVNEGLYADREPVPVNVDDIGELIRARPTGRVSTRLQWDRLSAEDFERLLFELVRTTEGYENADWPMKTNVADRGRDIQVYRSVTDSLAAERRYRVIIQCKHWSSRSVGRDVLIQCIESVRLWEPPRVDVLILATTGGFSQDAVALAERRDGDREVPAVELWSDSHLETLLSRRPDLVTSFGLR